MDHSLRDIIADALGMSPEEQALCDQAGSHPYDCTCSVCLEWWKSVGPDPDGGQYGAFTIEQVEGHGQSCEVCQAPATRLVLVEPPTEEEPPLRHYYCDEHFP